MSLSRFALAGSVSLALFALAGCGSTDVETPVVDETGRQPPAAPPEKAGDGEGKVYAVDKLFLGESDRTGAKKDDAWKEYGFNLDGKISDAGSTDLCQPFGTATPSLVYTDGNEGIDNSFGKNVLNIITAAEPNASLEVSNSISEGDFTIILQLDGLGADASYNPLTARLFVGASLGAAPAWDGNDEWPLVREFLNDPTDPTSSKVVFSDSYVADNTWVSGKNATLNLSIAVAGFNINLPIQNAVIAMDLSADHTGATNGTIAGVLPTEQLITELKKVIGAIQESLCSGTAAETIFNQIRQASDVLQDGTQDPSKTCDGISIGIGFSAKHIKLGPVAEPAAPAENPCEEAPSDG
ncbi:hypothetical protein [Chondromyces apiculatus]|uniref:Lipoprotein n=1 Tax=Chondromyces apiculatus DSM 436 TaxID=1192034 RepID=A0A017TF62_9BACT|nr:hypothetical protein [Chondromyces apiculatus]EYF07884.1 Hypothetical protein CAP_6906 [Chondromyces apiculatus DSM 436]